jgi:hypothetical protein
MVLELVQKTLSPGAVRVLGQLVDSSKDQWRNTVISISVAI